MEYLSVQIWKRYLCNASLHCGWWRDHYTYEREREREREREIENEREREWNYDGIYILIEIIRGHWPMFNRTMLSLHVSSLSILKNDQRPFNKHTHVTQEPQPVYVQNSKCYHISNL